MHYLLRDARRAARTICEWVDKMRHALTNNTLNLYCDGLQEIRKEAECLKTVLSVDEIVYHE
jgi:hypothetical protein